MAKHDVRVAVKDDSVLVSCDHGEWTRTNADNPILWLLTAVCYPDEHDLEIEDHRMHRQSHQKKLAFKRPDE